MIPCSDWPENGILGAKRLGALGWADRVDRQDPSESKTILDANTGFDTLTSLTVRVPRRGSVLVPYI